MSDGPSLGHLYGRAASHVGRIMKGAHPGDLAIERPSRFLPVINQRTAAAMGLAIPESVLRQPDRLTQRRIAYAPS
jgi:putative ABC transport system substrate-binding protein